LKIEQFEGAKVYNLLCFPLAQYPERKDIETQLSQREKRYLNLQQAVCHEYTGAFSLYFNELKPLFPSTVHCFAVPGAIS
jgi:hypothetical protein